MGSPRHHLPTSPCRVTPGLSPALKAGTWLPQYQRLLWMGSLLSIPFVKLFHIVASGGGSLIHTAVWNSIVWWLHLFLHPTAGRHRSSFQLWGCNKYFCEHSCSCLLVLCGYMFLLDMQAEFCTSLGTHLLYLRFFNMEKIYSNSQQATFLNDLAKIQLFIVGKHLVFTTQF